MHVAHEPNETEKHYAHGTFDENVLLPVVTISLTQTSGMSIMVITG